MLHHLSLVAVSGRLIVVRERREVGEHRQDRGGGQLDVGRYAGNHFLSVAGNVEVDLLVGTHHVDLVVVEQSNGSHHTGAVREEVETGGTVRPWRWGRNQSRGREERGAALGLPDAQRCRHVLGERRRRVAENGTVELDDDDALVRIGVLLTSSADSTDSKGGFGHAEPGEQRMDVRHIRLTGGHPARVRKVVQQTTRRTSGVCTGHKKPHASGSSFRTEVVLSSAKKAPRWTNGNGRGNAQS